MIDFIYSYDWYDGPRSGVASYQGQPFYFESQWIDVYEQGADWFKLSPLSHEVFEQELERWQLWTSYEIACREGLIGPEHHPFLPSDRLRGEELEQALKNQLVIDRANCLFAQAEFSPLSEQMKQANRAEMVVQWTALLKPPASSK